MTEVIRRRGAGGDWQRFKELRGGQVSRDAAGLYGRFKSPEMKKAALSAKTRGLVFQNPHTAAGLRTESGARARRFSAGVKGSEPTFRPEFFWKGAVAP